MVPVNPVNSDRHIVTVMEEELARCPKHSYLFSDPDSLDGRGKGVSSRESSFDGHAPGANDRGGVSGSGRGSDSPVISSSGTETPGGGGGGNQMGRDSRSMESKLETSRTRTSY